MGICLQWVPDPHRFGGFDNGGHKINGKRFQSSGPLRGYKRDLTEGGIRVPFIARWGGVIEAKQTSDEVIAFQDMMPTSLV